MAIIYELFQYILRVPVTEIRKGFNGPLAIQQLSTNRLGQHNKFYNWRGGEQNNFLFKSLIITTPKEEKKNNSSIHQQTL